MTMQIQDVAPSLDLITENWHGERDDYRRPLVPSQTLDRLRNARTEHIWGALKRAGYPRQFEGMWKETNPGKVVVGRAFTCAFLPHRPDLDTAVVRNGASNGFTSAENQNSWVVDSLREGDFLIADIFGKVIEGTVLGDNLGTAVATRTHVGAVVNGGVRDLAGLSKLTDVNIYFRELHPTRIQDVTLANVNRPISLGNATFVPGDVVVGTPSGIIAIPSHLADKVADHCEDVAQRDNFAKHVLASGEYSSDAIDVEVWPADVEASYQRWLSDKGTSPQRRSLK